MDQNHILTRDNSAHLTAFNVVNISDEPGPIALHFFFNDMILIFTDIPLTPVYRYTVHTIHQCIGIFVLTVFILLNRQVGLPISVGTVEHSAILVQLQTYTGICTVNRAVYHDLNHSMTFIKVFHNFKPPRAFCF